MGSIGFVGGLNIGDEYLGLKNSSFGFWRDTHLKLKGEGFIVTIDIPSRLVLYDK